MARFSRLSRVLQSVFTTVFTVFTVFTRFSVPGSTRVNARARCLRPGGARQFQTKPDGVPFACLGASSWSPSVRSAPRRVPRVAMPRRRLLPYPGSYATNVNNVVNTDCKTRDNTFRVTAPEGTPYAAPGSAKPAPTRSHPPPFPPAFNVEALGSGHEVSAEGLGNFEPRGTRGSAQGRWEP